MSDTYSNEVIQAYIDSFDEFEKIAYDYFSNNFIYKKGQKKSTINS